ncbi:acyltransferase family protein [Nocardia sp. SYP-A9097]|uniref:acyltransferase family protein n=1 Tax=Nocardia sp. SYP-A9097 TaxID=2663237 RepID=UPI00129AC2E0|nr:acyltransferase [Nocardia sp. SYP-A9097]MRH88116.1 acyltransferase family protein [Nocardia sp. SYP-A9097]
MRVVRGLFDEYVRVSQRRSVMTVEDPVAAPVTPVERVVGGRGGRFEFLDALRGLAALAVVVQHSSERLWPAYFRFSQAHFGLGEFGVFVFFLVSGFIIPASLERGRSLGAFWVGRFFRLFPLFWACLVGAVILHSIHRYMLPGGFLADPVRSFMANLTMMQFFIGSWDIQIIGASWSLSYELTFYLLLSLLLIAGLNRRSVPLAVLAVGLIAPGALLPAALITGGAANVGTRSIVAVVTVVVAAVFVYLAADRRLALAAILIAFITVPLVLNQPGPSVLTFGYFATMFVGTVLYRITSGEVAAWRGWAVFGFAICVIFGICTFVEPVLDATSGVWVTWVKQPSTIIPAYLVFAGALLLRRRSFPRPLLFLGRISYSLYVVHALVLDGLPRWTTSVAGIPALWLTFFSWVIGAVVTAAVTYRLIEKPCHNLGHRMIARVDARKRAAEHPRSVTA